ncbi:MAG: hypothetical protein U7127_08760 [Phormidium sp.]
MQEVSDFIDFITQKHLAKTAESQSKEKLVEAWLKWFESVDRPEVTTAKPASEYQQLLLKKYRQQGLIL